MSRTRTTWAAGKTAMDAPANPGYGTEDQDHPAKPGPDPAADAHNKGDTVSWAEENDGQTGEDGPAPAMPTEDGEHPAKKAAERRRFAAAERRASHAIRLAEAILPSNSTVATIEDQATDLMAMSTEQILSSLDRLSDQNSPFAGGFLAEDDEEVAFDEDEAMLAEMLDDGPVAFNEEEAMLAQMLAEDDEPFDEDEAMLAEMLDDEPVAFNEEEAMLAQMLAEDDEPFDEDEAMLAEMLDDEPVAFNEEEAMLAQMLAEDAPDEDKTANGDRVAELEAEIAALRAQASPMGEALPDGPNSEEVQQVALMDDDMDPMAMMDLNAEDEDLSALYGGYTASKKDDDKEASEDDAEVAADDDDKEAKKAAQRPQARKASAGVKQLGSIPKQASDEINSLSALWASAPDVSDHF